MKELTKEEIQNIRKNPSKYNWWYYISSDYKLSEDFIREFQDKVDWINISYYQDLSENFILEFKDRINWVNISLCQKLSDKFIRENLLKLNKELLLHNSLISEEIKETLKLLS